MKSETQNIYNFCMKKKNVKQKVRKWKLFFIVLGKKRRQDDNHYNKTFCHFFICSSCVFTAAGRRANNKFHF